MVLEDRSLTLTRGSHLWCSKIVSLALHSKIVRLRSLEDRFATLHSKIVRLRSLEDRSLHSLEDRSLTLTRRSFRYAPLEDRTLGARKSFR